MLNRTETREYLKNKYGRFIVEWRNKDIPAQKKSWLRIASSIIDQEENKELGNRNPDRLRKIIRSIFDELSGDTKIEENVSETIEGEGYSDNLMGTDAFKKYCATEGIDYKRVKSCKYVNHQGQRKFNIVLDYKDEEKEKSYLDLRDEIIKEMDTHSPSFKEYENIEKKTGDRLMVIGLADLHIGQLSSYTETHEEYNADIAIEKTITGVMSLLKSSSGFDVSTVLLPLGGDALNIDTPSNTTTSGTDQDNMLMWYDAWQVAKNMYIKLIEAMLSQGYKIVVKHIVSNHDYMSSYFLSDVIKTFFKNTDIEFDTDLFHRKYYIHGTSMVSMTHGDGAKKDKLALLAANECKEWSNTKYRYIYTQHIHHKQVSVDEIGVVIQSLRTPVKSSGWASRNGYQHAHSSITGFIIDKEYGEIAQLNHNF